MIHPSSQRPLSREQLSQHAALALDEAACKELATEWGAWETTYLTARSPSDRAAALAEPGLVCASCPCTAGCIDLARLNEYTGIVAGVGYRNGAPNTFDRNDRAQDKKPDDGARGGGMCHG